MAEVVLFHHVLGLTAGVEALADELRRAGHDVHVPDLFEGRRFDTIEAGIAHVQTIGFSTVLDQGRAAVDQLPGRLVYVGVSLGVVAAQCLAMTRPGAAGAVLLEACVPATEFGDHWPAGVPVQIHGMADDPSFAGEGDLDAARQLVDAVGPDGAAELFVYPGDRHLFTDRSLPSYDPAAAGQVLTRMLGLLDQIDSAH